MTDGRCCGWAMLPFCLLSARHRCCNLLFAAHGGKWLLCQLQFGCAKLWRCHVKCSYMASNMAAGNKVGTIPTIPTASSPGTRPAAPAGVGRVKTAATTWRVDGWSWPCCCCGFVYSCGSYLRLAPFGSIKWFHFMAVVEYFITASS